MRQVDLDGWMDGWMEIYINDGRLDVYLYTLMKD